MAKQVVKTGVSIEVEYDTTDNKWHGWAYKKIKGKWFVSAVITPADTKELARQRCIALAK
jgi:hypothetical protein